MENRFLIIGDEFFGEYGEVASRCSELMLCAAPNRPMQFSLNAPVLLTIPQLLARSSADIIGKKAGKIILGLGFRDLMHERGNGAKVAENYSALIDELLKKMQSSQLYLVTLPKDLLPNDEEQISVLNEAIRGFVKKDAEHIHILDFEKESQIFQEKQLERGKFARSLYSESAKPTSLCLTLLSMFLQDCILKK